MIEEPKWPTTQDILDGDPATYRLAVRDAIDACRAAWLASVDDPSQSPVGEVREGPLGQIGIRTRSSEPSQQWFVQCVNGSVFFSPLNEIKGWKIIGAVPGTSAKGAVQ